MQFIISRTRNVVEFDKVSEINLNSSRKKIYIQIDFHIKHIVEANRQVTVSQITNRFDFILRCAANQCWQQNGIIIIVDQKAR